MELQTIEQTQPLLEQPNLNSSPGLVSVRFCVYQEAGCCPSLFSCCRAKTEDAIQAVVPDTTTVGQFLQIVNETNRPKNEYTIATIAGFRLRNEDLIAPTIKSFERFESPIVIVPKDSCCLLI
ncbi:hypothetical protein M9Y10_039881 [Tritrichomonas musculus]|uniref:Uncharacterized protein n=1 Tax=Tritrichomonas musculus TaxID=1915356 RepID=A0ABR2GQN2_9EUKA